MTSNVTLFGDVNEGIQVETNYGTINAEPAPDTTKNECLSALLSTHPGVSDPQDHMRDIEQGKGGLLKDSYEWIIHHPSSRQFQTDDQKRLLWIRGEPGHGKTMLLIGIIKDLEHSSPEAGLAYFFCQGPNAHMNSATAVLRGLIYRLIISRPSLITHLRERYDRHNGLFQDRSSFFALSDVAGRMLRDPELGRAFIVIDALDECETSQDLLLNFIAENISVSASVKWIVSSRNVSNIIDQLSQTSPEIQIHLDLAENPDEGIQAVNAYIDDRIAKLSVLRASHELKNQVRDVMRDKAANTFLWVAIVAKELEKVKKWNVLKVLDSVPSGLEGLYDRMMKNIENLEMDDTELCYRVLATATLAYRPLHLAEMGVLAGLPDEISSDPDNIKEIVNMCGSFFRIQNDSVQLIHQSAKDYLHKHSKDILFASATGVTHLDLFTRSIHILSEKLKRNMYQLEIPGTLIDEIRMPQPDPLREVRYSCVYWVNHLWDWNETGMSLEDVLQDDSQVHKFLKNHILHWLEASSLVGVIADVIHGVIKLQTLIKNATRNSTLKELIEDIYRFVLKNGTMIQMAPLQAYVSALLFTPSESLTRRMFANEQPRWIPKKPIVDQKWGSTIHSIDVGRAVHWLTFSHDSKLLASQLFSHIQIWDVSTGLIRAELEMILGWDYPTCSIIFSYDSSLLASASARGHIVIWDVATGARKHTIQTTETIETIGSFEAIMATGQMKKLTFSRDSNLLGVCCNRYSEIWETKTWSLRKTIPHKMHDGFGWRRLPPAYFSPDMKLLIPPPSGGKIELWDIATCSPRQTFQLEDPVSMIVFSHDAKLLAAGSESGTIYIWNIASSSLERTIRGHVSETVFLQFSQDSQTFISASKDGLMKVWNAINWSVIPAIDGQTSRRFNPGLNLMSVSNDSKLLALGSNITVQSIQIWDMERFSQEHRASEPSQRAFKPIFSEDLKRSSSVSASGDLTITVGSTSSGAVEKQLKLGDHTNRLVGWSHDMRFFAWTADDGTTNIGELSSGELKQILRHPGPRTEWVTFSFDGNYLALVGHDKRGPVTIWSMATGQLLLSTANEIQRENGLAFSHDSRFLAVACASDIKIWDIEKAPRTQPVKQAGTGHHRTTFCLAFSHDSGLLAGAPYNAHKSSRSIDIWSTSTMTLIKTITMESFILSLSFNSDDTFLITGDSCVAIRSSPSDPISTGEDLVAKAKYLGYYFRGSWIELHGKKMVYIPGDYRKIGLRASHFIAESQSTHFQPVTRMASRSSSGRSWLMELVETEASYV